MNSILVPVDFSDASSNALSYAVQLFESSPMEITVLHIYGAWSTALVMKNIDHILEADAEGSMNKLLNDFRRRYPKVVFKPKIMKDYAVSAIADLGDKGGFDLIVMGTAGASGLKEVFMGSVAGGVISSTSAPVIVVPKGYRFQSLTKIVFAVSNIPCCDVKIIEPLRNIVAFHNSELQVLHFSDNQTPHIEKVLDPLEDLNPTVKYSFGTGDINKDISDYLAQVEASLLCLVRSKKGLVDRLFKESVTLKQTFNSPVPLLILHDTEL